MYATIGILGALTLGLVGALGVPSILKIRELRGLIAEDQEKIDTRYALRRYIRNSVAGINDAKRRLSAMSAVALQEGKELDFIQDLEYSATINDVDQIITLETVNQKDTSTWEREIPVKLEVTGVFTNVIRHLNTIERLPAYLIIETIQVAPPRLSSRFTDDGVVEALVQGYVYWQSTEDAPDFVSGKIDALALPAEEELP
jgi:hypothetical protein